MCFLCNGQKEVRKNGPQKSENYGSAPSNALSCKLIGSNEPEIVIHLNLFMSDWSVVELGGANGVGEGVGAESRTLAHL